MPQPDPSLHLPLTPAVFHILLALAGGERHGYSVMQEVEARTGGIVRMGPGTLYGSIKRMVTSGLIESSGERQEDGERRRYYALTKLGRAVLRAEAERLRDLVSAAEASRVLPREVKPRKA
jgi:DNA-binding PadR family transcriptional regulator